MAYGLTTLRVWGHSILEVHSLSSVLLTFIISEAIFFINPKNRCAAAQKKTDAPLGPPKLFKPYKFKSYEPFHRIHSNPLLLAWNGNFA